MVPDSITIYRKSTRENIINLIFITPLFLESIISYDVVKYFDHDSEQQPILSI